MIEDLIFKLRESYTIIIVTHNIQQAGRISDCMGFLWLGELIEFGQRVFFTATEFKLLHFLASHPVSLPV